MAERKNLIIFVIVNQPTVHSVGGSRGATAHIKELSD